jgi:hypothetical protein
MGRSHRARDRLSGTVPGFGSVYLQVKVWSFDRLDTHGTLDGLFF